MEHRFIITRMTVIDGRENAIGNALMATFDMRLAGVRICNCVLLGRQDGRRFIKGPKGQTTQGHDIAVHFEDNSLHRAVTDRALAVYHQLSGQVVDEEAEA